MKTTNNHSRGYKVGFIVSAVVVLSITVMQTACSIDVSISPMNSVSLEKGTILNMAVTSDQKALTIEDQFQVQSSSGSMTDQVVQTTNSGYTVFVSTQGAIFPVATE